MIFFTIIFLLITKNACIQYSGQFDEKVRTCLLDSLFRYHNNLEPQIPNSFNEVRVDSFPEIVLDIKRSIVSDYLDTKSRIFLGRADLAQNEFVTKEVENRLFSFCPYFLTSDLEVNTLIHMVLSKHFKDFTKIENTDTFMDALNLLIIKFIFNRLNFERVPRNIYYYLLSFISEFIHGTNSVIPSSINEFVVAFLRNLISNHKLPKSQKFMSTLNDSSLPPTWTKDFELFCSLLSQNRFDSKSMVRLSKHFVFHVIFREFIENRHPNSIGFGALILELLGKGVMSTKLVRYRFAASSQDQIIEDFNIIYESFLFRVEINEILKEKFNSPHRLDYFLTRSSKNPFSIVDAPILTINDMMATFAESKALSLAQIDMFSKLIHSERFNSNDLGYLLNLVFSYSNPLLLEIIIKEKRGPLAMFFKSDEDAFYPVFSFKTVQQGFFIYENHQNDVFFTSFVELMGASRDPLIFLTMSPKTLKRLKPFIIDRFDFDLVYNFNLSSEELGRYNLNKDVFTKLSGKTLSFKDIICHIDNEEIKGCFTSTPSIFWLSSVTSDPSPISVDERTILPNFS